MSQDTGEKSMKDISDAIKEGAEAFLKRQNTTIGKFALALGILLFIMYAFVRKSQDFDPVDDRMALALLSAVRSCSVRMFGFCRIHRHVDQHPRQHQGRDSRPHKP